MIILQEAEGPIKRKERYRKKDTQHKDQLRKAGKISTSRHSIVGILPPLQPCKKTTCSCEELVDDKDSQTPLQQNYIKTVKEATNNDAGNLLLLNYIFPASHLNSRKRKVTEKMGNRFTYQVPRIEAANESWNGSIELCRDSFAALFKLGMARMTQLQKRRIDPNECIQIKIKQCGGQHGFRQHVLDNLKAVLETEPRETSHYTLLNRDNSHRYYYSGGMSLHQFWIKYLELYGTGDNTLFLAPAKEKQFYHSYHQMSKVRRKPVYTDIDPIRKPSVLYYSAMRFWDQFNIKFEARKCDICDTCFRLWCNMNRQENTNEEKDQAKKASFDHQKYAQLAIWVRGEWKQAVNTNGF
jgi:hypothetical protein